MPRELFLVLYTRLDADLDFHLATEAMDDCHQPVDSKATEFSVANAGEIGMIEAGLLLRLATRWSQKSRIRDTAPCGK